MAEPADSPLHSPPAASHQKQAAEHARRNPVACAVLTVSDTRTPETDIGGKRIRELLSQFGHAAIYSAIVKDEPNLILAHLRHWLSNASIDAILTTGGTGISQRDGTVEVVRQLLTAELEGFGELFRMLSFQQVGAAAMLSRAVGGMAVEQHTGRATFLFAMPGSPNAVETAMSNLIGPQLSHLVWERKKHLL